MEFNVIKCSEVKSDNISFRIDAEFFRKAYLQIVRQVEKKQFSYVDAICSWVTQGPNPVFSATGIPCLTGRNINHGEVSYVDTDHVDEEEYLGLSRYQLQVGDTLITLKGKGSIGKVGFVTNDRKAIFSRDIGIIRPVNINPGYLNVFFLCKYGKQLVDRGETGGTGQSTLTTSYLKAIPVPRFGELEELIGSILNQVEILKRSNSDKYRDAESFLLSELGLSNWQPKHKLSFVKNYTGVDNAGRMDAEYFQPKYDEIVKAIKNYPGGWDTLKNLCELVGHPSNPPYADTQDENKTFIVTQKHLGDYSLNDEFWKDDEALYTTKEFIEKNGQYKLREDDILLYSVGAYIGKANIYRGPVKATIGSFLTMLRVKRELINPYYLMIFLNTDIGVMLSKQHQRGMAQQYLYPYDIRTFPVPLLKDNMQQDIQQKIIESFDLRKQSKHLLECAKRAVEIAIEEDEETAMKWLETEAESMGRTGSIVGTG